MENKCETCGKEFHEGDKVIQDRYFFRLHCSEKCLLEYMYDFFYIKNSLPNVIIRDGCPENINQIMEV